MSLPQDAVNTAITIEDVKDWQGQDVLDTAGDKLGKLDDVFYDAESDAPAFAGVKSGLVSKHLTLVPLAGATAARGHLRVRVSKDQFKNAPSYDPESELSPDDEATTYGYFGIDYLPVANGSRRLAKH
jgi:hypothetical protein